MRIHIYSLIFSGQEFALREMKLIVIKGEVWYNIGDAGIEKL